MTATLLTPLACRGTAVELSADTDGRRRWRKQIVPLGEIDYGGQRLRFDKQYLTGVKAAFDARAFDSVPLQLATPGNDHNNSPELTRGVIDGLTVDDELGLVADVATDAEGSQLLGRYPELGVSVRLIQDLDDQRNSRTWPAALQHVLATWDPRITGMQPWEAVNLSNSSHGRVIDLSGATYARQGGKGGPMAPTQEDINQAVQEGVAAALAKLNGDQDGEQGGGDAGGYTPPSDEELDELAGAFFGDLENGDGEGGEPDPSDPSYYGDEEGVDADRLVDASRRHTQGIELANARGDDLERRVIDLTEERDEQTWQAERRALISRGHPPHAVDMARDALKGRGKQINLSNGGTLDVADMVRGIFETYEKTGGLVDMSRSVGTMHDGSDQTAEQSDVDRLAAELIKGL